MYGLSKKKMPYLYPIDEAIGLLNNEIRLVEWRIKYPEQWHYKINCVTHYFFSKKLVGRGTASAKGRDHLSRRA